MRVVGLFAGIGGIELGLQKSGHECVLLCEKDSFARAVLEARFPDTPLHGDVRTLDALPGDTELVAAGFPCQDLSQAGKTGGIEGEQSSLVGHLFRLLEDARVPWVLLENVPFMLRLNRGAAMDFLVGELERLGYRWAYRVIDTRAFGLPQRRRRVFLLASRIAEPARLLLSTDAGAPAQSSHEGKACGFYWTEGNRGLGWAVDATPPLKGGSGLGIPSAPAIWMPDGAIVTPEIRDAERLQGFSADWTKPAEEVGRPTYRWKLVGNAVSVPAAKWIGELLAANEATTAAIEGSSPELDSWPHAAFRGDGTRRSVNVSAWPETSDSPSLAAFLRFPSHPLSRRATAGFWGRLKASSLNYPPAFGQALQTHLDRVS